MALVQSLCSRAILLAEGHLKGVGKTKQVLSAYLNSADASPCVSSSGLLPILTPELQIIDFFSSDCQTARKSVFCTADVLCFAVDCQITRRVNGLRIGIDLVSLETGEVLFRSFDDDLAPQARDCGSMRTMCRIPANLLKPGAYKAKLLVGIHNA